MRRWLAVVSIGSLLLVLAACSRPPGVDGNLVDDWAGMSTPVQVIPAVGECRFSSTGDLVSIGTVDCNDLHEYETAYVGTFTGSAAARVTPPPEGSAIIRSAYAKCQAPVTKYLGAEWHVGMMVVTVVVPDEAGWTGGSRWFKCDVSKTTTPDSERPDDYTKSVRGSLAPGGSLRLTCVNWSIHGSSLNDLVAASCSKLHNGEFAGVYTAPDIPYPSAKAYNKLGENGCTGVVGKFLGFHGASDYVSSTVGYAWMSLSEDQWNMGNRTIRCYADAYTKDRKFIGSVEGIRGAHAKG